MKLTKKQTGSFRLDFTDHYRIRHRITLFKSKERSEAFAAKLADLLESMRSGEQRLPQHLAAWLRTCPKDLHSFLQDRHLIPRDYMHAVENLDSLLQRYLTVLRSRGVTPEYVLSNENRIKRLLDLMNVRSWREVTPRVVEEAAAKLGEGPRTVGYYLTHLQQFASWVDPTYNPVAAVQRPKVVESEERRAFTQDEVVKLLSATHKQPVRQGLSGFERCVLYTLALETGLRLGELRALRWSDFDFDARVLRVRAVTTKNRKSKLLPLRASTAATLQQFFISRGRCGIFGSLGIRPNYRASEILAQDMKAAGIEKLDALNRKLVFHSFRHTFITLLDGAGATHATRQALARHSTPQLTAHYTSAVPELERAAVEALPEWGIVEGSELCPNRANPDELEGATCGGCGAETTRCSCGRRESNPHTRRYRNLNPMPTWTQPTLLQVVSNLRPDLSDGDRAVLATVLGVQCRAYQPGSTRSPYEFRSVE